MEPGLKRIRFWARAGALGIAALAIACIALLRVERAQDDPSAFSIISYIESPPRPHEAPHPLTRPAAARTQINAARDDDDDAANDTSVRLWRYNARGEIVFDHAEQFERCILAHDEHRNEADCPNADEPRPFVLRRGADAGGVAISLRKS
jgi:hypothetical protein